MNLIAYRLWMKLGQKKGILIIMMISLFLNVGLYGIVKKDFPDFANSRDTRWSAIGENLHLHGAYSYGEKDAQGNFIPTMEAPPIYPFLYSCFFSIFGNTAQANELIRVISIVLITAIVYLTYKTGALFGYHVGCAAALMTALDLKFFRWANNYLVPDILSTFLVIFSVYFFVVFIKRKASSQKILFSSLLLSAAIMTKGSYYLLWIPLCVFLAAWLILQRKFAFKNVIIYVLIFAIFPVTVIGAWKIRNYFAVGSAEFSSQKGYALLLYNVASMKAYQEGGNGVIGDPLWGKYKVALSNEYVTPEIKQRLNEGELSKYLSGIAVTMILKSPFDYLTVVLKGIKPLLYGYGEWPNYLLAKPKIRLVIYFFSVLGMLLMGFNKSNWPFLVVILLCSGYVVGISSPISHQRYTAPIIPFLYIQAGYFFVKSLKFVASERG